MTSMTDRITGGVDTHLDMHVAAALDQIHNNAGCGPGAVVGGRCTRHEMCPRFSTSMPGFVRRR
jgi:hypothetical protein